MDINFTLWVIVIISVVAKIVPDLAVGRSFKLSPFEMLPSFFEHFLTLWHHKIFWETLLSLPRPQDYFYFSKEPWFLLLENSIWKRRRGHWVCSLVWGIIACRPSQPAELGSPCMYTHTRAHTCIYVRLWKSGVHSDSSLSSRSPQGSSSSAYL